MHVTRQQRPEDWRYILEDSGAKCLFVATKGIYRETFHFAGVQGNVQNVFCFDQPAGQPGSFKDLLDASVGEGDVGRGGRETEKGRRYLYYKVLHKYEV